MPAAHLTAPGLDRAALLALRRPRHDTAAITTRIAGHLGAHDGYVALSGGKDSLVTLHLALAADPAVPVAFFDSGFEFPETYRYLTDLSREWNLTGQLHWIRARMTTLQVLHATGTWDHRRRGAARADLRGILITEPSRRAHAAHGPGELWGVRAQESRGRAALYARALRAETAARCGPCCCPPDPPRARRQRHGGVIRRLDGTVAYGPIWDWTTDDVWAYISRHRLPVNPVYDKLRRLGAPEHFLRVSHLLDGGRLEEGRVTWLRRGWPDLFDELAVVLPRIREYV